MPLGTWLKRGLHPLYQDLAGRVHDLQYFFLELTTQCNLACLHCGSDCRTGPGDRRLPRKTILKVLREIRAKYDPHRIAIILAGGEPLCYPGVFDLGEAINELEFPWGMVTNGYAWTADTVADAEATGLQSITVSLDGMEADHDWLRQKRGSFQRAVKTITMLTAHPFWSAMDVVTCVNRRNLKQLEKVYDLLRDLGVPQWRLFIVSPIGRAAQHDELFLKPDEFHALLAMIREFRSRRGMETTFSESGYLGRQHELTVRDQPAFCRAGINVAGLTVEGDFLACLNIDRRFAQGNAARDSFVATWENGYRQFRDRTWMRTGECLGCREWKHCRGNSFHLWDLDAGRPKLCHLSHFQLERSAEPD